MRVSILTLYGANNVGAFLQTYLLQEVLGEIVGRENVSFINFSSDGKANNKIQKVLFYLKQGKISQVIFKYKTAKKYAAVMHKLNIDKSLFSEDTSYDIVIAGSDEIWNLESNNFIHHPQYFGKNIRAAKMISYAPSCNNTEYKSIRSAGMDFSSFDYISVRDVNTQILVKKTQDKDALLVCDPTLLIDTIPFCKTQVPERNYILVYSYQLNSIDIKNIKRYAKSKKKKLVSVGTYNKWCDKNIVVDPFEFLNWLNQADEVITSTFHGTVLSVRFHKRLAVFAQTSQKVKCFLEQVGLGYINVSQNGDIEEILSSNIDYDKIDNMICSMSIESMNYLRSAMGVKDE